MTQPDHASTTCTPRWVRVFGVIAIVLALFVLFAVLTGGGPPSHGRRPLSGDAGGDTRWGLLILLGFLFVAAAMLNWSWLAAFVRPGQGSARTARRRSWWPRGARGWPSMTMAPGLRKLTLTAHVTSSVGLLGAVASFLALAIAGLTSQDAQMVRGAYLAMELTAWFVVVPLAFAALLFGIVQSLGSQWGLFRHWWVLVKLLLTVLTIIILLLQMEGISYLAEVAAETTLSSADLLGLRRSIRTHAGLGLLVLLVPVALSLYKPRGMTRYGRCRQNEARLDATSGTLAKTHSS